MEAGNNWLVDIFNSMNEFKNGLFYIIITGMVVPVLKFFMWVKAFIDSKISKYILLPIKDESNKDEVLWFFGVFTEIYKSLLPIFIILGIAYTFLFFANALNFANGISVVISYVGMFLLLLFTRLIKRVRGSLSRKVHFLMGLLLVDIYVLFMLVNFGNNNGICVFVIMWIMSWVTYIMLAHFTQNEVFIKKYMFKEVGIWPLGLKIVRTVMALSFLSFVWIEMMYDKKFLFGTVAVWFFVIWFVLCIGEWAIIEIKDRSTVVDISVFLNDKVIVTRKRIEQINENKIKLLLEDGCERVVECDIINSIQYCLKNYFLKSAIRNVVCILNDGSTREYQGYKYLGNKWVRLHRVHEDRCEIVLMHDARVKEIRCE